MIKFSQVALAPQDPKEAIKLLSEMGSVEWIQDHVTATGTCLVEHGQVTNEADLAFNYEFLGGQQMELEVLHYTQGPNWVANGRFNSVSHLGAHCTEDELNKWKEFFDARAIPIVQEVFTQSHTNAYLLFNKRKYHYCIFGTKWVLGVDLKFIVRIEDDQIQNP